MFLSSPLLRCISLLTLCSFNKGFDFRPLHFHCWLESNRLDRSCYKSELWLRLQVKVLFFWWWVLSMSSSVCVTRFRLSCVVAWLPIKQRWQQDLQCIVRILQSVSFIKFSIVQSSYLDISLKVLKYKAFLEQINSQIFKQKWGVSLWNLINTGI